MSCAWCCVLVRESCQFAFHFCFCISVSSQSAWSRAASVGDIWVQLVGFHVFDCFVPLLSDCVLDDDLSSIVVLSSAFVGGWLPVWGQACF